MGLLIPTRALDPDSSAYPRGYHRGNPGGLPAVDTDLVSPNIRWSTMIFGVIGDMVQWIATHLEELVVPGPPSISMVALEDHSGGAFTSDTLLTVPAPPSIAAAVAETWLLIDDCEAAWDEYVQAGVTSTADAAEKVVGAASAKMAVTDPVAVGRLATNDMASTDLSPYRYLKAWVRCSIALAAGDLAIDIDDTPQCVSPLKQINIPALTANTWTQITLDMGDTSALTAIVSIGITMIIDKAVFDFWIDQVRATEGT